MVDPPNCVSDPPNSRLSGHADPPTSQRYFERWDPFALADSHFFLADPRLGNTALVHPQNEDGGHGGHTQNVAGDCQLIGTN